MHVVAERRKPTWAQSFGYIDGPETTVAAVTWRPAAAERTHGIVCFNGCRKGKKNGGSNKHYPEEQQGIELLTLMALSETGTTNMTKTEFSTENNIKNNLESIKFYKKFTK